MIIYSIHISFYKQKLVVNSIWFYVIIRASSISFGGIDMEDFYREFFKRFDSNIYVRQCGKEYCEPSHAFGPAIRDHFLIHFIVDGKGKFYHNDKIYEVNPNQMFLICPDETTYYEADERSPWTYLWVGFNGSRAITYLKEIGLTIDNPVISVKNYEYVIQCLEDIIESSKLIRGGEVRMLGHLYLFLSLLIEESLRTDARTLQDDYIHKAIEFMEMNFVRNITIQDIAHHLNLNRSYFSKLFKSKLNKSPQQYLISLRINKACDLLIQNENLPINNISRSVGYPDQLVFSKTFKRLIGLVPSDFRLRELNNK